MAVSVIAPFSRRLRPDEVPHERRLCGNLGGGCEIDLAPRLPCANRASWLLIDTGQRVCKLHRNKAAKALTTKVVCPSTTVTITWDPTISGKDIREASERLACQLAERCDVYEVHVRTDGTT